MRIVFDECTVTLGHNAVGVLYVDFDGVAFPAEGWTDFVVVLATWWVDAIENLARGPQRAATLQFMDGPYWITAQRQGSDVVLRCIDVADFAAGDLMVRMVLRVRPTLAVTWSGLR